MGSERFLRFETKTKGGEVKKSRALADAPALFEGTYRIEPVGGVGSMATSMLPPSAWRRPDRFPRLDEAVKVGVDIESHDPRLRADGPGFIRGDAHVVGVAVAARWSNGERFRGYYPIRHRAGENFDAGQVFSWLRDELRHDVPKVGANLLYDLEGLKVDGGVSVGGRVCDVQNAEGILDEESALVADRSLRGFSLEKLGRKYLDRGKNEERLRQIQSVLGLKDVKGRLRDLPPEHVGEYAEEDADLALDVLDAQTPLIERQRLDAVWALECDLVPLLLEMRLRGVRVDVERAAEVSKALAEEHRAMLDELRGLAGFAVDPWSSKDLARLCETLAIDVMRTSAGNPSFTADWLRVQKHPAFQKIGGARKLEKMRRDFVEGVVIADNVRGRIHAQFHQLRKSEGEDDAEGTRSGRFSSTNPNLQQIPKRDDRFGPLIRGLFLPDEGKRWLCCDYSSQEFRLLAHYAVAAARAGMLTQKAAAAAEALREAYQADPKLDYHQKVADMTGLPRKTAKPLNLMLVYGAGERKVAVSTGWITEAQYRDRNSPLPDEVRGFFGSYHAGVPFVKELLAVTENLAATRGYVTTKLGRRRHFELYVPKNRADGWGDPLPLALARAEWGDVPMVRADARKALNSIIQGSAADMTKLAMLNTWRETGIVMQLTVHDELDLSVGCVEEIREVHARMVGAMPLHVPVLVDLGLGDDWAAANADDYLLEGACA